MAKTVEIDVKIDTKKGEKSVGALNNEIKETNNQLLSLSEQQKNLQNELENTEKGTKKYKDLNKELKKVNEGLKNTGKDGKKSLKLVSLGFKAVGTAMKAAGIGLVIAAFATLKSILEQQQPVLDMVDTAFTAINIVISEVTEAIGNAFEATQQANGGFQSVQKVVGGLITIALAPLRLAFNAIKSAVIGLQLAWEKSIFGDGDKDRIKELEGELDAVGNEILQIGTDVGNASSDIVNNIGDAVGEVTEFVGAAAEEIKKIDTDAIASQARRATELKNAAKIAEAVNKGVLEQYDILAEKQRQIRDDERNSITVRIQANNKLGEILNKQKQLMLENANTAVEAAKLEYEANKTTENRVKLIEAQNEVQAVQATIEGFRSEQLINNMGLEREQNELTQMAIDRTAERAKIQRDFAAEQIEDDTQRINQMQKNLQTEKAIELERLQNIISSTKKGTLARVEAEQNLLDAKVEFNQKEVELEKEKIEAIKKAEQKANEETEESRKEKLDKIQTDFDVATSTIRELSNMGAELIQRRVEKESEAREQRFEEESEKLKEQLQNRGISREAYEAKLQALEQRRAQEELKAKRKAFNQSKALNIANATMGAANAVIAALATPPPAGFVLAGISGALAAANIALIASQQFRAARGGIVPSNGKPSNVDSVPALLAPNETVINAESSAMFPNLLSEINKAGGGVSLAPEGAPTQTVMDPIFRDDKKQNTVRAIVVESDITDSQRRVSRMERAAEF